jgi:hypothetical protein
MAGLVNSVEAAVLDYLFGLTTYTPASNHYIGLYTTLPAEDGSGGVECSGGSYARVLLANNKTTWSAASGGALSNAIVIEFPKATASWGTVVGFGLFLADSGGTPIAFGSVSPSKAVEIDDILRFAIGDLDITLD